MKKKKPTTPLFLHVSSNTKRWLKQASQRQVGRVSMSTLAEQIFNAAKKSARYKQKAA